MNRLYLILIIGLSVSILGYKAKEANVGDAYVSKIGKHKTDYSQFQEGDIIFHKSKSSLSKAIELATGSEYTHVGVLFKREGQLMVLEAIQPVKYTSIKKWIQHGVGEHYVLKRLQKNAGVLDAATLKKMRAVGASHIQKDYDSYFEWTDNKLYCSELVWKVFDQGAGIQLSPLKQLRDFDLSSDIVRKALQRRYGESIPLDEPMIDPGSLFASPLLETVQEG